MTEEKQSGKCNVKLYDADDGEFMGYCCLARGHNRGKNASAHKINYEALLSESMKPAAKQPKAS